MSGETEQEVSGWTVDTLKAHVDMAFELRDRATQVALDASDKRLDGMNEFRASLGDLTRTLMPRLEAEQRIDSLTKQVDELAARIDQREGQDSGTNATWGYVVGFAGLFLAAAAIAVGAFT